MNNCCFSFGEYAKARFDENMNFGNYKRSNEKMYYNFDKIGKELGSKREVLICNIGTAFEKVLSTVTDNENENENELNTLTQAFNELVSYQYYLCRFFPELVTEVDEDQHQNKE